MDRLFAEKSRELAAIIKRYRGKSKTNVWKGNTALEREVDKILIGMDASFRKRLLESMGRGQNLANDCRDIVNDKYLRGIDLPADVKEGYYNRNSGALSSWLRLREKGLELSTRVWKMDEQTKEQMEFFLKSGIAEGRDAPSLARDIQKYLKEPDRRFRRVKDENGVLQLSNPAKQYHPGRGVYRSSYKNALRVARNEINIAYRRADHERVKNLDFVKGIKVNLSNAHPRYDICDELVGLYPKTFVFTGWHPNCLCFSTTVLMDEAEFVQFMNTGKRVSKNIETIPRRAQKEIDRIAPTLKKSSNPPYWIKDNFKSVSEGFDLRHGKPTYRYSNERLENNIAYAKENNLDSLGLYANDKFEGYEARQALREGMVNEFVSQKSSKTDTIHVLGGATANGKSTLLESGKLKFPKDIMTVDSDALKAKIPEYPYLLKKKDATAAAFVHEESSMLSKQIISKALDQKKDFVLDGVNDGNFEKLRLKMEKYRDGGRNRLVANYVTLDTDLSIKLAKARAEKTGRKVPLEYIKSVNKEIPNVVEKLIANKVMDELYLWDTNINKTPRLILSMIDGKLSIYDQELYARFKKKGL